MKTAIPSIVSLAIGIAIGFFIPANSSSDVSQSNTPETVAQNQRIIDEKQVQGKWFCNSSSGWKGVYEILPEGVLKGYPEKGDSVIGSWTIQTSLRLHHTNGAQDNLDLPNSEGVIVGVSKAGNKLTLTRTK